MKHLTFYNFIQVLLALIITLFIFSCQKEDKEKQPFKQALYDLVVNEWNTETRNGGHQFVLFQTSGTIVHTLLNLNPQILLAKSQTDSIVLEKVLPEIDANVSNGTTTKYCYLYTATIYHKDILPSVITLYAPFTNGNRNVITYTNPTIWNNNIVMAEIQQGSNYQVWFDYNCQIDRRNYVYRVNRIETDTSYTQHLVLTGNWGCGNLYRLKMDW